MVDLTQYKNVLGRPGEGVHSYRFFNIAIVDVLLTIIAGLLISYASGISAGISIFLLFVLGVVLHRSFGVKTTIDKLL